MNKAHLNDAEKTYIYTVNRYTASVDRFIRADSPSERLRAAKWAHAWGQLSQKTRRRQ